MSNKPKFFRRKSYKSVRVGEWLFEWHMDEKHPDRSFMRVLADSGLFDLKIKANSHVFGYLLVAAEKGMTEQLHGWITLVCVPAMSMTQDQELTNDISRSIGKWMKRKEAEAEANAAAVTEAQEAAEETFMESVVEYAAADKRRREEIKSEDAEVLEELMREGLGGDGGED